MIVGFLFMAFSPWMWLASPDKFGKWSMLGCFFIGLLFFTLGVLLQ